MSSHLATFQQLERLGFPDLLLWLLTFAVVYGVLTQAKVPKSAASRAIISIVSGMLVLMAAPASLISIISNMSTNLILLVLGLLVLIVFLEAAGVKILSGKASFIGKDGKHLHIKGGELKPVESAKLIEKHSLEIGIIIVIVAALIFIGSGGLSVIGLQNINLTQINIVSIGFLLAVILAVVFLYFEKGDE